MREYGKGWKLASIAIVLVCVTVVIVVVVRRPVRPKSPGWGRRNFCRGRLQAIGMGCRTYTMDYEGMFPDQLSSLYPAYVWELSMFVCPDSTDKVDSADGIDEDASYVYVTGLTISHPGDTLLAYDNPGNHGEEGRCELYVNGHVEWVKPEDW